MTKLIELNSISAGYSNVPVLEDVNLEINNRDFLGIIGPNGGGKTTLLKVILGLLRPLKGKIEFFNNFRDNKSIMGYLPQFRIMDSGFPISVEDVVLSGLISSRGTFKRFKIDDRDRALDIMKKFGVLHLKKKPIGNLSGGQMQRVFLCRALISSPELLVLDEPGTFVDRNFSHDLNEILKELNNEIAIILVSHDIGSVLSSVKNIACVNRTLHYHSSEEFTHDMLEHYTCEFRMVGHGDIPHTVLKKHGDK